MVHDNKRGMEGVVVSLVLAALVAFVGALGLSQTMEAGTLKWRYEIARWPEVLSSPVNGQIRYDEWRGPR